MHPWWSVYQNLVCVLFLLGKLLYQWSHFSGIATTNSSFKLCFRPWPYADVSQSCNYSFNPRLSKYLFPNSCITSTHSYTNTPMNPGAQNHTWKGGTSFTYEIQRLQALRIFSKKLSVNPFDILGLSYSAVFFVRYRHRHASNTGSMMDYYLTSMT